MGECPLLAQSGHSPLHRTCPLLGVKRTCRVALHMSAFDPKRTLRAILSVGAAAYLRSLPRYHRAATPTIGRAQMCALVVADEPNPNRPTVVKTNATIQRSGPANPGHQGASPGKRTNSTNGMSANAMRMPFIQ
jgi:hypothetical protein